MADTTSSTPTLSSDRRTMVAAKLLMRSQLKLVAQSICEKQKQEKGTGTTFTLIRYSRMNIPTTTLTEGTPPTPQAMAVETVTGGSDQWGDMIKITDVASYVTLHPLTEIATELLGDNAQRVIDREIQIIMQAGTNVLYGDGSVTSRATVTTAMTITDNILLRAKIIMGANGAPLRSGPSNMRENASAGSLSGTIAGSAHFVIVAGLEVMADVMRLAAANGLWGSVNQYNNGGKAIYTAEVGMYLNYRFVETNFIPRFKRFGNAVTAAALGADAGGTGVTTSNSANTGTLVSAGVYGWKITRKSLQRGFEEDISIIHTTSPGGAGDNEVMSFVFPATAGYVYNLYFDSIAGGGSTTDAALKLVQQNIAAGATVAVASAQATGVAPPPSTNATGPVDSIYPVYVLGDKCLVWTGLQALQVITTGFGADKADPLGQFSTIGYKFMAKAAIMNQLFMLRLELASAFNI